MITDPRQRVALLRRAAARVDEMRRNEHGLQADSRSDWRESMRHRKRAERLWEAEMRLTQAEMRENAILRDLETL